MAVGTGVNVGGTAVAVGSGVGLGATGVAVGGIIVPICAEVGVDETCVPNEVGSVRTAADPGGGVSTRDCIEPGVMAGVVPFPGGGTVDGCEGSWDPVEVGPGWADVILTWHVGSGVWAVSVVATLVGPPSQPALSTAKFIRTVSVKKIRNINSLSTNITT